MKFWAVAVLSALLIITGCGGGSSNNSNNNNSTAVAVTISPTTATLNQGQTTQFTATVTNSSNTAVTWQVSGVTGGSATVGFISTNGLYTAPASVTSAIQVTVQAVSQADTTKTASATVVVNATIVAPTAPILVSAGQSVMQAGSQQTFTATVNGTSANVVWSVSCQSPTGDCGTISNTGVYTAPFFPPPGGGALITATSADNTALPGNAGVTIQISNQSLFGRYAFAVTSKNGNSAAGSVVFDGQGNVTGGVLDIRGGVTAGAITGGTYNVGSDGRGAMTAQAAGGSVAFKLIMVNHNKVMLVSSDAANVTSGTLELQTTSSFNVGAVQGAYSAQVRGISSANPAGAFNMMGAISADGNGGITSGAADGNDTGTATAASSVTGTYSAPSTDGRGTLTLSSTLGSQSFIYFIVDGSHLKLLEKDTTYAGAGDLRKQTGGPFSNGSLRGVYVAAISGAGASATTGTGGLLTPNGNGSITATVDINNNGNVQTKQAVTGTYANADATTGRTTMTLALPDGAHQYVLYPSQNGEFLLLETGAVSAAGLVVPQPTTGSFGSTFTGNFAALAAGTDLSAAGPIVYTGRLVPNGGSVMSGTLDVNTGAVSNSAFSGSYTFDAFGRASVNAANSTGSLSGTVLAIYAVDTTRALFLEIESGRVLTGEMQKQF